MILSRRELPAWVVPHGLPSFQFAIWWRLDAHAFVEYLFYLSTDGTGNLAFVGLHRFTRGVPSGGAEREARFLPAEVWVAAGAEALRRTRG